jgi:penicillin-binding protein 1A
LKIYPDTKRSFDIPVGVFRGQYEGKSELYTKHSPFPETHKKDIYSDEENNQMRQEKHTTVEDVDPDEARRDLAPALNDENDQMLEEETNIVEDTDPDTDLDDGEIGLAPTLNIDEGPVPGDYEDDTGISEDSEDDGDPLHPSRKVPLNPVSNDSGTLF